jgi:iron complex outermembrane receptor protein
MGLHHSLVRLLAVTAVAGSATGATAAAVLADDQLADLSLDQLMGITVTSASKKEQSADEVASAIFVLTQEDIRRSGATSIPEALRLVPGVNVAQSTPNAWSVTARGFNGRFANKLLVLMDGRSVYTPLFAGTYWDAQDTLLEDIERIEVIRGPGATVWGANAVNGVINIITKSAEDTHGLLATTSAGNEERFNGGARWGGQVGDDFHYRAYGKYFNRDGGQSAAGVGSEDDWDVGRFGFRTDWSPTENDRVTFQGDFHDGDVGQVFSGVRDLSGAMFTDEGGQEVQGYNVLGRWSHTFSETMDASVQFYYDRVERFSAIIGEERDTLDLEFQHRIALPFNQELIWGGGYRYIQDDIRNSFNASLMPDSRHDDTFSFFVQDEIRFWDEKARLTFGTKIENNDYTGWEYQPSVRLSVSPHEDHTFWGAVSRAIRVPSRAENDVLINSVVIPGTPTGCPPPGGLNPCPPTLVNAAGNPSQDSERMYSFEAGWRARLFERLTLDVAAFYSDYDYYTSVTDPMPNLMGPPGFLTLTSYIANGGKAQTHGVEVDMRADLLDWWRVIVGYSYLHNRFNSITPSHTGVVRSQMDLPFDLELDATLYLYGNVVSAGTGFALAGTIPSFERLDLRLGWRPTERVEVSLVGQNLTDDRHPEYFSEIGFAATQIQRAVYGKINFTY